MNRLLTILLLLGATAHGQINNPPTSVNIVDSTATGRAVLTATNAAAAATAIGLGTANEVNFNRVQVGGAIITADDFSGGNFVVTAAHALTFASGGTPGATLTNLGLGAANNVTFSNITASGTLGVTGNATFSGTANLAPSQTADSGSSLMTRDLVGQEFANPRNKIQTTYWFGLEGLGEWSLIGSGAVSGYVAAVPGFGSGRAWYSTQLVGTNHAGAGLRLGNDTFFGGSPYRFSDGGALTMRGRIRRQDTIGVPALAFVMGSRLATQMWQQNAHGLYFVPQPTNSWVSSGAVTQHDRIAVGNVVWAVNTAGTNDATEPTWTDLIGSLVTNGSAVYRNLGPHTSNNWVLGIGSTNASQVVMTNTGKTGLPRNNRAEVVLKLRIDGTTNTPYTVYGTVENYLGESTEVSLTTTNNQALQPQFWNRADDLGTRTNPVADLFIKYFSIDGTLGPL